MTKTTYTNLKLKNKTEDKMITFNELPIKIKAYLPTEDKYDLINIALEQSSENGIFNPLKLDMFFHLFLVYFYTDITFTEKQKENTDKIYDNLKSSGLLDLIISAIPDSEYNYLFEFLELTEKKINKYNQTISALIQNILNDFEYKAESVSNILQQFDQEKLSELAKFSNAIQKQ